MRRGDVRIFWLCKCDCGLVISRDQNAAINILNEGLRILNESFDVA